MILIKLHNGSEIAYHVSVGVEQSKEFVDLANAKGTRNHVIVGTNMGTLYYDKEPVDSRIKVKSDSIKEMKII